MSISLHYLCCRSGGSPQNASASARLGIGALPPECWYARGRPALDVDDCPTRKPEESAVAICDCGANSRSKFVRRLQQPRPFLPISYPQSGTLGLPPPKELWPPPGTRPKLLRGRKTHSPGRLSFGGLLPFKVRPPPSTTSSLVVEGGGRTAVFLPLLYDFVPAIWNFCGVSHNRGFGDSEWLAVWRSSRHGLPILLHESHPIGSLLAFSARRRSRPARKACSRRGQIVPTSTGSSAAGVESASPKQLSMCS